MGAPGAGAVEQGMHTGAVFPQSEIGADPGAVRAYVAAVSELGYHHILAYDHVVGADRRVHQGWTKPYDMDTTFHEPMVLFGYVAALADIELVTGIIILPQRQTVLAAKQAAEVDLLTEGRFRMGIGLGWNAVEYEALGKDFHDRGRRLGEQVQLMRRLWTERSVTHRGTYETVTGAGIWPLPVQQPIPVWFGGRSDPAYRRAGALADGWFPQVQPGPDLEHACEVIKRAAEQAGRDPASIGMEGRVSLGSQAPEQVAEMAADWAGAGATHVSVNTMDAGLGAVDNHIEALAAVADAMGLKQASNG